MSELAFPDGFLWGAATAAHQVEGDNTNSDWWAFEHMRDTPCKEPSGTAIEHYKRYPRDIAVLAGLGLNTYRFSVEWARIEPIQGQFDEDQLDHYRKMVELCCKSKLTPMVTLNHFTLPKWLADRGGWLNPGVSRFFERYSKRVVEALGDRVDWYCTINEPGMVALGGYGGGFPFPPRLKGTDNWKTATTRLIEAHKASRAAIKGLRPSAMVGLTNAMTEWESNAGGAAVVKYIRGQVEDVYLEAATEDDFIGVQTYTRARVDLPRLAGIGASIGLAIPAVEKVFVSIYNSRQRELNGRVGHDPTTRNTQMGYEFRPQAVAATVRRAAKMLPGKPIVVTEHGVATADDRERVEFITEGLRSLHAVITDGIPLKGYIHWSAFDNFEWASGYSMTFGLVEVNRTTQERIVRPSGRLLGDVAQANELPLPG